MKKITTFIKKNKVASIVLLVALILAIGITVAYSQTEEQMRQELAAKQQSAISESNLSDTTGTEMDELSNIQVDNGRGGGGGACAGSCKLTAAECSTLGGSKGGGNCPNASEYCCVVPTSPPTPTPTPKPTTNPCTIVDGCTTPTPRNECELGGCAAPTPTPTPFSVTCTDLHGTCTDDWSTCNSAYLNAEGCNKNIARCCVPIQNAPENDCEQQGDNYKCQSACGQQNWTPAPEFSCGDRLQVCCKEKSNSTVTPTGTSGDNGDDDTQPNPTSTPPTNNVCKAQVTCGACDQDCSEGSAHKCRTCQTADGACSYREACGNNDTDPIYKSTCGKGDFIDNETRQQRKETLPGYTHVKCTGTSTCTGGPNADGLYWCVQELAPTTTPPPNCSTKFQQNSSCDTKCGKYFQCSESDVKFQSCAESAACKLATPTNAPPPPTPAPGTDTGTLDPVTVTAAQGPCGGHTKVYWTATTANTSNGYWLYRGTTADFKPSEASVVAGNISPNRTVQSPYYDWLSEPGKKYYYRVIASGTGGNTKWSNAAEVTTSSQCGSSSTTPNNPSPTITTTTSPTITSSPAPTGDYMTKCNEATGRGANCACTTNTQCSNGWCNGGKCHYAPTTSTCPATNKPSACICETNAQCTSGWCNGGRCN